MLKLPEYNKQASKEKNLKKQKQIKEKTGKEEKRENE